MANGKKIKSTRRKPVAKSKSLVLAGNTDIVKADDRGREWVEMTWDVAPEGGEHDSDQGIQLAKVRLLNTNSKELRKDTKVEGAEVGKFYNVGTGELFDEIELVPLMVYQERYYNFPKGSPNLVCMSIDGKAQFGICPSGNYEEHKIPTRMVKSGNSPETQVGVCANCPKGARAWGEQSECQFVKNLICFDATMLKSYKEHVEQLVAGNPDTPITLLNALFFLPFQSTKLRALKQITQQANRDQSYFAWSWLFRSQTESNEYGEWVTYNPTRKTRLDTEQMIFARSLYKFAQKVRPIITDFEDVGALAEVVESETGSLEE